MVYTSLLPMPQETEPTPQPPTAGGRNHYKCITSPECPYGRWLETANTICPSCKVCLILHPVYCDSLIMVIGELIKYSMISEMPRPSWAPLKPISLQQELPSTVICIMRTLAVLTELEFVAQFPWHSSPTSSQRPTNITNLCGTN